jgi:hypothetical protein
MRSLVGRPHFATDRSLASSEAAWPPDLRPGPGYQCYYFENIFCGKNLAKKLPGLKEKTISSCTEDGGFESSSWLKVLGIAVLLFLTQVPSLLCCNFKLKDT